MGVTQITISNGITTITMPGTRKVSDAGSLVYRETQMASGKIVRDIKGFRAGFKYDWDYVPAATIASLATLLRSGSFFAVNYFDIDGTDGTGTFSVSYPAFEVFGFVGGVAMWHNCSLVIQAQEVT